MLDRHTHATRIVSIDAHPVIRWAIARLAAEAPGLEFGGEAGSPDEAMRLVGEKNPDLCIAGLHYFEGTGFALIRDLRIQHPHLPILIYSSVESEAFVLHCLRLGVRGYVCKSEPVEQLLPAIHRVLGGGFYLRDSMNSRLMTRVFQPADGIGRPSIQTLSPSELEVFHLIGSGLSNPEIAARLHRSIKTVETYRTRIKAKLGLRTGIELSQFAYQHMCMPSQHDPIPCAPEDAAPPAPHPAPVFG